MRSSARAHALSHDSAAAQRRGFASALSLALLMLAAPPCATAQPQDAAALLELAPPQDARTADDESRASIDDHGAADADASIVPNTDAPESEASDIEASSAVEPARFVLEAGAVAGFAWVSGGLPADSARPAGDAGNAWVGCNARGDECEVRVAQPGFGRTAAVRIAALVAVLPTFSIGVAVRGQPSAGEGALAGWLLDVEAHVTVLGDTASPAALELVGAIGAGQIQSQPPQDDGPGPFVSAGIGWGSLGATALARIDDGVHLALTVLSRAAFPVFLFDVDLALALRVSR